MINYIITVIHDYYIVGNKYMLGHNYNSVCVKSYTG